MKKTYLLTIALLFLGQIATAQSPANRSAKTIVADVLAQMPAEKPDEYNKIIEDLSRTGEEGVLSLVKMMKAPGKGSNANIEYALSGLSHFVTASGKEAERMVISQAYIKALELTDEQEIKAFILRQLQIVGKDECIETLAEYVNDNELSAPATAALSAIGTPDAGKVLISALKMRRGTEETQQNIITAIGEMQAEGAEPVLRVLLNTPNEKTKKALLYALGRTGTLNSLEDLEQASAASGYTMDKSDATEAYITLLKRLSIDANAASSVKKAARQLMKKAEKADQTHTRSAAFQILLSVSDDDDRVKLLEKAIKSSDYIYRNAALNFASDYAGEPLYAAIGKIIKRADDETKTDLLNWFGREAEQTAKQNILKDTDIQNKPFGDFLTEQFNSPAFTVREAATWVMVKMGDADYIPVIASLLTSSDEASIRLGKDALSAFPGNINKEVAQAISKANDAGKIAGLELLAMRRASSESNTVFQLLKSESAKVKDAAYGTLKAVVTENDAETLCDMLDNAEEAAVPSIQQAIVSAISSLSKDEKKAFISKHQDGRTGYRYYPVFTSTGMPEALNLIGKKYESETGMAKQAAFDALLNWEGQETAPILYRICQSNPDTNTFNKALERYIQLSSSTTLTGENRLLRLRQAMDIAKTNAQRNEILKQVEQAGTYLSLLYAGEFLGNNALQQTAANAVMNIALNHKEYTGTNIRSLLARVSEVLNNPDAQYQRESIRKHLAEMPEETGFVSIFNGKDLTGWKGLVENPIAREKMSPATLAKKQKQADEQMRKDWKVENGLLVFDGTGFDNLCTEKKYGDFEMYIDWMLDPKGPEADAGIYLRGTPQVQIWDTARVNVGAQVGSGGLYNNQINPSKPLKVADNPLGEWNTFYIKMVGDRVTVLLNGEKVVDDVILENYWDRSLPIPAVEQLELQAHGSKVYYRNIYVKELARKEPFQLSEEEKKEGFQVLFDGTNMHEWTGNTVDYTIEDGCISMNPSKHFGGNLYTKKEYANFIFRFEFQLTPGANNGVGLRAPLEGDAAYVGMESQILDCEHEIYKDITKYQHHGSIYGIIPAKPEHKKAIKPVGEWNEEEIICDGDNIRVTVNGIVIVEGNIREATKNGTPDGQEHPGLFNKKGHIGFLGHGSPLKFRNIRIKELK